MNSIPAYQETARKRVYHELARSHREPISAEWLEQLCAHVEEGHPVGETAARDLLCELIRLQFDLDAQARAAIAKATGEHQ